VIGIISKITSKHIINNKHKAEFLDKQIES